LDDKILVEYIDRKVRGAEALKKSVNPGICAEHLIRNIFHQVLTDLNFMGITHELPFLLERHSFDLELNADLDETLDNNSRCATP